MTHNEKVRKILERVAHIDQTISQLNTLYKPRIDEKELREILEKPPIGKDNRYLWTPMTFGDSKGIAHAIAQKAEEIIKYD